MCKIFSKFRKPKRPVMVQIWVEDNDGEFIPGKENDPIDDGDPNKIYNLDALFKEVEDGKSRTG